MLKERCIIGHFCLPKNDSSSFFDPEFHAGQMFKFRLAVSWILKIIKHDASSCSRCIEWKDLEGATRRIFALISKFRRCCDPTVLWKSRKSLGWLSQLVIITQQKGNAASYPLSFSKTKWSHLLNFSTSPPRSSLFLSINNYRTPFTATLMQH